MFARYLRQLNDVLARSPQDGDTLVFDAATNKWRAGAGGGGSQPVTYQDFTGVSPSVDGAGNPFNWTTSGGITQPVGNSDLLDLGDPTLPTFKLAGTYSVSFTATPDDGAHVGKYLVVEAQIGNEDAADPRSYQTTEMAGPFGGFAWAGITHYANANDILTLAILHDIGSDTAFDINVYVQRLS